MTMRHKYTGVYSSFFFFNDTATTEIYTLSLHDALPICLERVRHGVGAAVGHEHDHGRPRKPRRRRKLAHLVAQPGIFGVDRQDHEVGKRLPRPLRAGREVVRFGNLETTADGKALESLRA